MFFRHGSRTRVFCSRVLTRVYQNHPIFLIMSVLRRFSSTHGLSSSYGPYLTYHPAKNSLLNRESSTHGLWVWTYGVDNPHFGVENPHFSVNYLHFGVDYPHPRVDNPHPSVDYPHQGMDYPRRGVDCPHLSVDQICMWTGVWTLV